MFLGDFFARAKKLPGRRSRTEALPLESLYLRSVRMPGIAMRRLHISLLLVLCAMIAACGNKGPLVLPDQKPQTQPQPPAATPAPAQDTGKQ